MQTSGTRRLEEATDTPAAPGRGIGFSGFMRGHADPVLAIGLCAGTLLILMIAVWVRLAHADILLTSRIGLLTFGVTFLLPSAAFLMAAVAAWCTLQRCKGYGWLRANLAEGAQIGIALCGMLVLLWSVADVPSSLMALAQAVRPAHLATWSVRTRGTALFIRGEIAAGLGAAVDQALLARPDLRTVFLDSPGGDVGEALRVADVIEAHGLSTVVRRQCASACTALFVAGRERRLLPLGRLGFHACRYAILWYWPCSSREQERRMVAAGIDRRFGREALSVDAHRIWYPPLARLIAAGVVTGTDLGSRGELTGQIPAQ